MKMRPETAKVLLAQKLESGQLVSEELAAILEEIPDNAFVIELGGIGEVSEYLANSKNCDVRLCEETRLYFVFRRNLLPKSSVTEINIDPRLLNYSKPCYDVVIINGPVYLEIARKLAKSLIVNIGDKSLERIQSAPDNTTVNQPVAEDMATQEIAGQPVAQSERDNLHNRDIQEGP